MKFDVIVIGGGHAGIEAVCTAATKNLSVLLITNHLDLIGQMSCNPSIGGIAKGNIVREIDALGGVMAALIDRAGIHFRMLNTSKGAAVWGNRAQADKSAYRRLARKHLENKNINLLQGMVIGIGTQKDCVSHVVLDSGEKIDAGAVILAMGTFLNGVAHIGMNSYPAGRTGEPPSLQLTESLTTLGIQSGRLKTGTSPRIDGNSVDLSQFEKQPGDENPSSFSFATQHCVENKTFCWVSRTNKETHAIILDNLDRSPLFTGKIKSIGPRYCPSIEDKVVRFGERDGHTLFLEPESLEHNEMYFNGLSTSLPFDVQLKMVRSVKGMENARILRPGYGIEYDYFYPQQLHPTLESKVVKNLYFAGQINGTSGYEEAACQGLIAGMNAALNLLHEEEIRLSRDSSYIGVLIDDLVTKGTKDPYRMFTSRAEYRLLLRQDNCDERLMPLAVKKGFLDTKIYDKQQRLWEKKDKLIQYLEQSSVSPENFKSVTGSTLSQTSKAADLLKRPEISITQILKCLGGIEEPESNVHFRAEWDIKYSGFIKKQQVEIERSRKYENTEIPDKFMYDSVSGLLTESKMKLKVSKPRTLGQASRISGVTPADISILSIHLLKSSNVSRETNNGTNV
jgi:tRNA uridine 5-carboxymethylaminomethyl modification enzyme